MRKEGEEVLQTIDAGTDTEKLLRRQLIDGIPSASVILSGRQARISIEAPPEVLALRSEL